MRYAGHSHHGSNSLIVGGFIVLLSMAFVAIFMASNVNGAKHLKITPPTTQVEEVEANI